MSDTETPAPQVDEPVATDTSTTVDTSEASPQTNEAPEATQETKEPVAKATDTADEKLYAGKYKSVEDMEKAYQELNSKYTNTSQEKAELAKILNDAFVTPEPQAQPAEQENYEYQESQPNQEMQQLKAQVTVQSFIMTHEDADAEAMGKVLNEDSVAQSIPDYNARLEYAYLKSKNMGTKKAIADAQKKSAESTQAKIVEKQSAQVESANQSAQVDEDTELRNKATGNYSKEERDAARKAWIRKNLVNL